MIKFEIDIAKKLGKPIIAIKPAEGRNVSNEVRQATNVLINWNVEEIIRHIRNPGATPIRRPTPVGQVKDTAKALPEIVSPPVAPIRTRESFKEVLKRTFGFRRRFDPMSASPPALGVVKFDDDAAPLGPRSPA